MNTYFFIAPKVIFGLTIVSSKWWVVVHPWIKVRKAPWRQVNGGALQGAMHRAQRKQE